MINTWNESLLHEELKDFYCGEDGKKEVPVGGSICDAVRKDGTIIEIQTANIGKLKNKLTKLTQSHPVRLIYPIGLTTTIETYNPDNTLKSRRKSPKKGSVYTIFGELTGIWHLLDNTNFTLELAFSDILEIRIADGTGSWRRKGVRKQDKKLLKLHESRTLSGLHDWAAHGAGANAGRMAWTLRKCGILKVAGKKGNAFVYRRNYVSKGNTIEILVPTPSVE
jgi:hypothetical protein